MLFDFAGLSEAEAYRLVVSTVLPRPIALTTTVDADGRVNAAPFSFFNAMGGDPPVLVIGTERRSPERAKDTQANITRTGEFVVNLVTEALAPAMTVCAIDFPPGEDELAAAGLTAAPSIHVRPPRVAESPVSFECRRLTGVELGGGTTIQIGQILAMHLADEFWDVERGQVRSTALGLIGRMHGRGWYTRTTDLFELPRMTHAQWLAAPDRPGR